MSETTGQESYFCPLLTAPCGQYCCRSGTGVRYLGCSRSRCERSIPSIPLSLTMSMTERNGSKFKRALPLSVRPVPQTLNWCNPLRSAAGLANLLCTNCRGPFTCAVLRCAVWHLLAFALLALSFQIGSESACKCANSLCYAIKPILRARVCGLCIGPGLLPMIGPMLYVGGKVCRSESNNTAEQVRAPR